jgi:hypothetical protein
MSLVSQWNLTLISKYSKFQIFKLFAFGTAVKIFHIPNKNKTDSAFGTAVKIFHIPNKNKTDSAIITAQHFLFETEELRMKSSQPTVPFKILF